MANYFSDPTANAAIGTVDRKLKLIKTEVKRLRAMRDSGILSPEEEERVRRKFIGFYRTMFDRAMSK